MNLMHPQPLAFLATNRGLKQTKVLVNPRIIILHITATGISKIQRIKRRRANAS